MIGRNLVQPLEDDWRETLDAVARARGFPTTHEVARLAAEVAKLSASYNEHGRAGAGSHKARLGFWFARDVPKGAGAVRELVASGAVSLPKDRPLRVIDLGAGLGAMTHGLARALAAHGARGLLEATWVDTDGAALDLGRAVVDARARAESAVAIRARTIVGNAATYAPKGREADVVIVGQVLSELDASLDPEARAAKHAAMLRALLEDALAPHGALVVVEPALRDRTRHLHRVRDAILREAPVSVFAPCLHAAPCPALAQEGDWCHEDLDVDLPAWLVPVARAAGLRYEGLTFSYLVLRAAGEGARRGDDARRTSGRLRVVSGPLVSKGKRELFLCGELVSEGRPVDGRVRAARLDRDAGAPNARWKTAARGDVLEVAPPLDTGRPRVGAETVVRDVDELPSGIENGADGASMGIDVPAVRK